MAEVLLTPEEAAKILSVSPATIREWIRTGKLQARKAGRLWRVRERDLETFLDGSSTAGIEESGIVAENLRMYSSTEIQEFLEADSISPETARKLNRLLGA